MSFEFVIVSGDISQTNTEKSYQLFNNALKQLNKPIYCIPGNHDDPELLKKYFPDTPTNSIMSIEYKKNLIIFVNTQVKNQQFGHVSESDLKKISLLLDSKKHLHAVIVLHHPPVSMQSKWMDNIGLKNGDAFLQAIQKHQNLKLVLFGHVHQKFEMTYNHIQLYATPSTCYQFKPESDIMQYDDLSPGYRLVKINNDGTIVSQISRI